MRTNCVDTNRQKKKNVYEAAPLTQNNLIILKLDLEIFSCFHNGDGQQRPDPPENCHLNVKKLPKT